MVTCSRRAAFTLIELLVVLAIIALLTALVVAAANGIGIGGKKAKTGTVIDALRKAAELTMANRGGQIAPAEHPLAGSQAPRATFVRGATTLASTGEALMGPPIAQVLAADAGRLLHPDDCFADPDLPLLFGLRRGYCTILGAPQAAVTEYRRLPILPDPIATGVFKAHPKDVAGGAPNGVLDGPYDATKYPDAEFKPPITGNADSQKAALDYLFGNSNVQSELASLKVLANAPGDTFIHPMTQAKAIGSTASGALTRVYTDVPSASAGSTGWKPGMYRDGIFAGKDNWKRYRLPGLAVYDAWGREILFSVSANGGIRIISAGPDGVMRWNPGSDRTFATSADATAPMGDDTDGARDNVRQETVE